VATAIPPQGVSSQTSVRTPRWQPRRHETVHRGPPPTMRKVDPLHRWQHYKRSIKGRGGPLVQAPVPVIQNDNRINFRPPEAGAPQVDRSSRQLLVREM